MNDGGTAEPGEQELDEIRRLVEGNLDRRIEDYQWQGLVRQRYPLPDYEGRDGEDAKREAVEATVQAWNDLYRSVPASVGRPRPMPGRGNVPNPEALRGRALTALYAADARQDKNLLEFRRTVLNDRLLPAGDGLDTACRDWILGFEQGWVHWGMLMSARYVADEPDEDKHYDMPQPLRDLHELTERLGKHYDWIKGATTMFVLSDQAPAVDPLRAHGRIPYAWISASRITLVIDPAISPEHVADFYRRIRKNDAYYSGAQVRPLTGKALLLAAFSAGAHDSERAIDQVKRWNVLHPEHPYDHTNPAAVSNFRRDMKQARDRLLNPKLGREANRKAQRALNEDRATPQPPTT